MVHTRETRIAGLDGLRALAVITVVLTHYGVYEGLEGQAILPLVHGLTGVRAFFVLSGFLITRLLLQEYGNSGRISYGNFLARRALRIMPLYFFFLVLVSLLYVSGLWVTKPAGLAYAWLYLYNFVPPHLYAPVLAHTWSLAVEEHFYLLWPLVLSSLAARSEALVRCAMLGALICLFSYVVIVRWMDVRGQFVERWTIVAAFSLLVGCAAALLSQFRHIGASLTSTSTSRAGIGIALLLFASPAVLQLMPFVNGSVLLRFIASSLQSVGIAVFLLWMQSNQQSYVVKTLDVHPLRYIGKLSYGIYIWQGFFLGVSPARAPGSAWPPDPAVGLLGVAILAPLSYHLFEKRFLDMKDRFRG